LNKFLKITNAVKVVSV